MRGQPRRQRAFTPNAVVHAAGVEPAQQRRDVQTLRRPVPVHDAEVGIARRASAGATRRARACGSRLDQRPRASTLRQRVRRASTSASASSRGSRVEQLPRVGARRGEPLLDAARARGELVERPARRGRRVHHREALRRRRGRSRRAAARAASRSSRRRRSSTSRKVSSRASVALPGGDAQQRQLVVAEHDARASRVGQRAHLLERAQARRAAVHQVADEPQLELAAVGVARARDQLGELARAALDVAREDALHAARLARRAGGP